MSFGGGSSSGSSSNRFKQTSQMQDPWGVGSQLRGLIPGADKGIGSAMDYLTSFTEAGQHPESAIGQTFNKVFDQALSNAQTGQQFSQAPQEAQSRLRASGAWDAQQGLLSQAQNAATALGALGLGVNQGVGAYNPTMTKGSGSGSQSQGGMQGGFSL